MRIGPERRQQRKAAKYKTTTLREFGGGWNVIDVELNMAPRFARIFDNVTRSPDGSVTVRYGYRQDYALDLGVETVFASQNVTFTTVDESNRVLVNWTSHPFTSGQHIKISGLIADVNGIPFADLNRVFGVRVTNANQFEILTRPAATSSGTTGTIAIGAVKDTHAHGANIVNGYFFKNKLIVVDEIGEISAIDPNGSIARIWDNVLSTAQIDTPVGWGPTKLVTFHVIGGRLIIRNEHDKPLELDFARSPAMQYLGDPAAGGANAAVPVGYIGFTLGGYAFAAGKPNPEEAELGISGKLVPGVWTGNPDPDDAVDVDMSKVSNATDAEITGLGELRGKLIVGFRDALSIGIIGETKDVTVGEDTSTIHEPDFKDGIPQHGCIAHRTIVSIGNDLLLCDTVGVPSIAQSQMSGQLVPDRVSDLIEPALQANISRLTHQTQKYSVWAVYNRADKQYMLFMPKYDAADVRLTVRDPIMFLKDLGTDRFAVSLVNHGFEEDDLVVVSGATDIEANLAGTINGQWRVFSIIDKDTFTIKREDGGTWDTMDVVGGGNAVTIQPINEETMCYVYNHIPKLKVKSWSRFRNLNFNWGAVSINNTLVFGHGRRVYRMGTQEHILHADAIGVYDHDTWANNSIYYAGIRILDDGIVYIAEEEHISPSSGTFAEYREDNPNIWSEYNGQPIPWVWEWPWGDFDKRIETKAVRGINLDTSGSGTFNCSMFVDQLYRNPSTGDLEPKRHLDFVATDTPGFGAGDQPFGGGRRTGEQPLWAYPVYSKLLKLRFEGVTTEPLRIVAVSIVYHEGTIKR